MSIVEGESATGWMPNLDDLRNRGVKDIFFLCSVNLKGLAKADQAIFPDSTHQICIVEQIRNSLKFVGYKGRKAIIKGIKSIYQSDINKWPEKLWNTLKKFGVIKLGGVMDAHLRELAIKSKGETKDSIQLEIKQNKNSLDSS